MITGNRMSLWKSAARSPFLVTCGWMPISPSTASPMPLTGTIPGAPSIASISGSAAGVAAAPASRGRRAAVAGAAVGAGAVAVDGVVAVAELRLRRGMAGAGEHQPRRQHRRFKPDKAHRVASPC